MVAPLVKKPIKAALARFPVLDALARRFVWRAVRPSLFFHEPEMRYFHSLARDSMDIAVDVGAAMGSYCWILQGPARKIYAFEPGRIHNACLKRASFQSNVEVVRAAVGSAPGKVRLYTRGQAPDDRFSASISLQNPVTQAAAIVDEVEQVTLDGFFAERLSADRSIDLIKIDVEGYELDVMQGALGLIDRFRPLIICEIEARHNPRYREVFGLLAARGYAVFAMGEAGFRPFTDDGIEHVQLPEDLDKRLHGGALDKIKYVNNFIFQHPDSKIQVG
ncbi:FkbM family methyltransferase [Allosphingosinicella sp.]|uniref:FkbM family methyltransferase n=1 Tax=Allosphingosinicella sp. TaxID=2823234 RepID=UPI00378510CE